jgi:hypothetical protein
MLYVRCHPPTTLILFFLELLIFLKKTPACNAENMKETLKHTSFII